jgi:hypothetical protein
MTFYTFFTCNEFHPIPRQALPWTHISSGFKHKKVRRRRTSPASQKQRLLNNVTASKMSSIDAVVNAGPSAQQQEIDEPVEKFDALNVREDSEGWNDVEDDAEEFNVQCLFCNESATSLAQSLAHMKSDHDFDLVAFRSRHGG